MNVSAICKAAEVWAKAAPLEVKGDWAVLADLYRKGATEVVEISPDIKRASEFADWSQQLSEPFVSVDEARSYMHWVNVQIGYALIGSPFRSMLPQLKPFFDKKMEKREYESAARTATKLAEMGVEGADGLIVEAWESQYIAGINGWYEHLLNDAKIAFDKLRGFQIDRTAVFISDLRNVLIEARQLRQMNRVLDALDLLSRLGQPDSRDLNIEWWLIYYNAHMGIEPIQNTPCDYRSACLDAERLIKLGCKEGPALLASALEKCLETSTTKLEIEQVLGSTEQNFQKEAMTCLVPSLRKIYDSIAGKPEQTRLLVRIARLLARLEAEDAEIYLGLALHADYDGFMQKKNYPKAIQVAEELKAVDLIIVALEGDLKQCQTRGQLRRIPSLEARIALLKTANVSG